MLCHTRMGERWRLSKPHAVLKIGLSDGAYSHSSRRAYPCSCGGNTRMEEWSELSKRHTPLEAGLSESTCSLLRRTIPNDEAVEAAGIARDAGNQFVRGHMLSPVESISEWGERWGAVKTARGAGSQFVRKHMLSHAVPDTFVHQNDGNAGAFLLSSRCLNKNMGYGASPHGP